MINLKSTKKNKEKIIATAGLAAFLAGNAGAALLTRQMKFSNDVSEYTKDYVKAKYVSPENLSVSAYFRVDTEKPNELVLKVNDNANHYVPWDVVELYVNVDKNLAGNLALKEKPSDFWYAPFEYVNQDGPFGKFNGRFIFSVNESIRRAGIAPGTSYEFIFSSDKQLNPNYFFNNSGGSRASYGQITFNYRDSDAIYLVRGNSAVPELSAPVILGIGAASLLAGRKRKNA